METKHFKNLSTLQGRKGSKSISILNKEGARKKNENSENALRNKNENNENAMRKKNENNGNAARKKNARDDAGAFLAVLHLPTTDMGIPSRTHTEAGWMIIRWCEIDPTRTAKLLDSVKLEDPCCEIMYVAKFLKKSERKEPGFTNVYVKNLDLDFTEDLLKEKFSEYGNVTSAVIMKDADGGSRGFGFVNFESPDSAKGAIEGLNGAVIGKQRVWIPVFEALATSVDTKALEETFGKFGKVVLTRVARHKSGISRGCGFLCFSNSEEADRACDSLNGNLYHGKCMNVSLAMSKEEYAQRLQARGASEKFTGYNPYYGMQSYGKSTIYDPYWQPNMFGSMQVFPTFKPKSYQGGVKSSNDRYQKPSKSFKAYFSEVLSSEQAHQEEFKSVV